MLDVAGRVSPVLSGIGAPSSALSALSALITWLVPLGLRRAVWLRVVSSGLIERESFCSSIAAPCAGLRLHLANQREFDDAATGSVAVSRQARLRLMLLTA